MRGAVERELDGEQPSAAADVEALARAGRRARAAEEVLPDEEAALRRHEHAGLDGEVGDRRAGRDAVAPARRPSRRHAIGFRGGASSGRGARPGDPTEQGPSRRVSASAARAAAMWSGPHAAAAADDLGALTAARLLASSPYSGRRPRSRWLTPAGRDCEVAEVGIDAERQVGEVPQPREHARHVVGRKAVDQERAHPDSSKRRAASPNRFAPGPPSAPEDAAHAVPAAPGSAIPAGPSRQTLDRLVRRAADERERLEQGSDPADRPGTRAPGAGSSLAVRVSTSPLTENATATSSARPAAAVAARARHAAPRDAFHPVHRAGGASRRRRPPSRGGGQRPRSVGRDDASQPISARSGSAVPRRGGARRGSRSPHGCSSTSGRVPTTSIARSGGAIRDHAAVVAILRATRVERKKSFRAGRSSAVCVGRLVEVILPPCSSTPRDRPGRRQSVVRAIPPTPQL